MMRMISSPRCFVELSGIGHNDKPAFRHAGAVVPIFSVVLLIIQLVKGHRIFENVTRSLKADLMVLQVGCCFHGIPVEPMTMLAYPHHRCRSLASTS